MTPLHQIGEFFRHMMLAIPMPWVRILFVAVLLVLLIWVLKLQPHRVNPPREESHTLASNLKFWAALALGIQIIIYLLL